MPWYNARTGLGTQTHSLGDTTFLQRVPFSRQTLETLYRQCGVARKIITRMPFDATREGWTQYPGIAEEYQLALRKEQARLRLGYYITQALIYERLFGGAAIILRTDDARAQTPWEPRDAETTRRLVRLQLAHRWELWPHTYSAGQYVLPDIYQYTPDGGATSELLHRSRLLIFPGEASSDQDRVLNWSWGNPVIESVWDEVRNVGISDAGVIEYLQQLSVPVLRLKKWWALLSGKDGESQAQSLLETFRQRMSAWRLMVLDSDDGVERLNATVTGLAEILEHQKAQVAAVTDYPQTVLYGRSPEGMNATGLSDLELYYGIVRAKIQEDRLREPLETLVSLIARAPVWGVDGELTNPLPADVRQQDPQLEFRPLWVPRELEREQAAQTRAATRSTYAALGWIDPDEGRRMLETEGILQPADPDEFEAPEELAAEVEANPLEAPEAVSAAVGRGILQARRSGYQPPSWEESVARRLAAGRAISTSQAMQLRFMLAPDSGEDAQLQAYLGGQQTYQWLQSLTGAEP